VNRRNFMGSILAAGMAPAVVGSGILMPLGKVWVPAWHIGMPLTATELLRYNADWMEHLERATRTMLVYGTGGVFVGPNGVRALGLNDLYKPSTGREIALKMKYAVERMNDTFSRDF
jgi:hypothetical protein